MSNNNNNNLKKPINAEALATVYNEMASNYNKMMEDEVVSKKELYTRIIAELFSALQNNNNNNNNNETTDTKTTTVGPILDETTGSGHVLAMIHGKLLASSSSAAAAKDYPLFGSDISAEMIKISQQHVPTATFLQGDMTDLKKTFPDNNSFAAVINMFAIHHVEWDRVQATVSEIARLLKKPGGVAVMIFWESGDKNEHGAEMPEVPKEWNTAYLWKISEVEKEFTEKHNMETVSKFIDFDKEFQMSMGFLFMKMK